MFWIPQPVKCGKCGFEGFSEPNYPTIFSDYCPHCLKSFLDSHVPVLVPDPESGRKWDDKRTTTTD